MKQKPFSKKRMIRLVAALALGALLITLPAACATEPARPPEAALTTETIVPTSTPPATAPALPPGPGTEAADAIDASGGDSAAGVATAVAARTPVPTSTPDRLDREVEDLTTSLGLTDQTFLGLSAEDWINILLSALIVFGGYFLITIALARLIKWFVGKTSMKEDDRIWAAISGDVKWLVFFLLTRYAANRLDFLSNEVRTIAGDFFFIVCLIFGTRIVLSLIQYAASAYRAFLQQQNDSDRDEQLDPVISAFHRLADAFVLLIALSFAMEHFGVNVNALYIVMLALALVLSLGSREVVTDAVSGFIILIDQPFRSGDSILIKDLNTWGDVVKIGTRSTRIRTGDHRDVLVPNSQIIESEIVNYTDPDPQYRTETELGVAYGTDDETMRKTISDAVRSVGGVVNDKPVDVFFVGFGESARSIRVRWWVDSIHAEQAVLDQVNTALESALARADIALPNTTYDLKIESDSK